MLQASFFLAGRREIFTPQGFFSKFLMGGFKNPTEAKTAH